MNNSVRRIKKARKFMEEKGLDALLLFWPSNSYYMSGLLAATYSRPIVPLIFIDQPPVLVAPSLEEEHARKESFIDEIRTYAEYPTVEPLERDPIRLIASILTERKLSKAKIGVEKETLPVSTYETLKSLLPKADFREGSEILGALRIVKDEEEVKQMKRAAELTDVGMTAAVNSVRDGRTELEVSADIDCSIKLEFSRRHPETEAIGYDKYAIYSVCRSGIRTALPHGASSGRKIRSGDVVINVVITTFRGYHVENERTIFVGKASERQRNVFERVLEARHKAMDLIKPGVEVSEIDRAARNIIEIAGYGRNFVHRTGHGLGLDLFEMPYLREGDKTKLLEGMTFSVEPGIYLPNFAGFRHSDTILVTRKGADILTKHERGLIQI